MNSAIGIRLGSKYALGIKWVGLCLTYFILTVVLVAKAALSVRFKILRSV